MRWETQFDHHPEGVAEAKWVKGWGSPLIPPPPNTQFYHHHPEGITKA